jgi:hypothetical protein
MRPKSTLSSSVGAGGGPLIGIEMELDGAKNKDKAAQGLIPERQWRSCEFRDVPGILPQIWRYIVVGSTRQVASLLPRRELE